MPLLSIKHLSIEFPSRYETDYAVEDVSFDLEAGEILGLVGESGAGKSTIGNGIVQSLSPPGRISKGDIYLNDTKISTFTDKEILKVRGSRVGFIFQDPMTSLNPLFTVENQLVETILTNLNVDSAKEASRIAINLLDQVGISDPEIRIKRFPHQFSGGMRQRVVISIALAGDPELLIADDPTTALDVSVQTQILNLLKDLQDELGLTMLFISHDLPVIRQMCDRVAIMRRGRILETADCEAFFENSQNEYSIELLALMPRFDRIYENEVVAQRQR